MDEQLTQTMGSAREREILGPRVEAIRVRISLPEGVDVEAALRGPRVVLGSHPKADLVVAALGVSAIHSEIQVFPDGSLTLRDLDSKNGTWVGGGRVRVREVALEPGASFSIGVSSILILGVEEVSVPISTHDRFGELHGVGASMGALFALLSRVASTELTVLVTGESGTGKELVARGLHEHSSRHSGPFKVLDCGGLASGVAESELFGHRRGAFTGAVESKAGIFEDAHGGTIFLDEIGELPLALQPKLLRALEARETCRLGETEFRSFDVRVIAATHRDLRKGVNDGQFREDLYFRMAQALVSVPPLRDREAGNVALLAGLFLSRLESTLGRGQLRLSKTALGALSRSSWPGNVRELHNVVVNAALLAEGTTIDEGDLSLLGEVQGGERGAASMAWASGSWLDAKREFERRYVAQMLAATGGNRAEANRLMAISPSTFHALLKRTGVR